MDSLSFFCLLVLLTVSILTCNRAQSDLDVQLNQICDNGEVKLSNGNYVKVFGVCFSQFF